MPFPRVRFTVRRAMVAVGVVALGSWGVALVRLSEEYRQRASIAEAAERAFDVLEGEATRQAMTAPLRPPAMAGGSWTGAPWDDLVSRAIHEGPRDSAEAEAEAARARDAARYGRLRRRCAGLKEKYRRAARYPFLPIAPDPPPEPE